VTEIRVRRAGAHDHRIEVDRIAVRQAHLLRVLVDRRDLGHQHRRIALPAQDVAQRRGDVGRRQTRRRDLVEQRLEQMMVAAIDQRDAHLRAREIARGPQARESATDDHHVGQGLH